jgi:hypothetical protein
MMLHYSIIHQGPFEIKMKRNKEDEGFNVEVNSTMMVKELKQIIQDRY